VLKKYGNFIENVLLVLLEYVPIAVRQGLSFRYDKVQTRCGKFSDSGWTCRISP